MSTPAVQRWRRRRDSCRHAREPFPAHRYDWAEIPDDTTARRFVQSHHYSGSYPAARGRVGLYRGPDLVGVAVFAVPVNAAKVLAPLPCDHEAGVVLSRFVLLDDVEGEGETWFLRRAFRAMRARGFDGVLSFADPIERTTAEGVLVKPGHVGTIYQAHNGVYLGRATARTLHLLPDGTVLDARTAQKIRAREVGWQGAVERLVEAGATPPSRGEDLRAWLRAQLERIARRVRHPGNHRYAWPINRRLHRHMPQGRPYPKLGAA